MTEHKKPAWEVVLETIDPKGKSGVRPRRMSLHTLSTILGLKTREEVEELAKELQKSGKVLGYRCPDVKTLIFYLERYAKNGTVIEQDGQKLTLSGMIDTRNARVWDMVKENLDTYPYPQVRGFKRFAGEKNAMPYPFEPDDFNLASLIIKRMKDHGYEAHIEVPDLCHNDCCEGKNC